MTETDQALFDPTPEELERQREHARAYRERVLARDWHELPKGHYAVPIEDWEEDDSEDGGHLVTIGWATYERRTPTVQKSGRVVGKHRFARGALIPAEGVDPDHLQDMVRVSREVARRHLGPDGYHQETVDDIALDVQAGDTFRATFGKLTGRCGMCGKKLTDAKSKLIGIGPDCRGYR